MALTVDEHITLAEFHIDESCELEALKSLFLPWTACPGGVCGEALGPERRPLGVQPARHVPLV